MGSTDLSDIPGSAIELEDFVAALFQSAGYFVEKNIVEADPSDILEVDLIATSYSGPPFSRFLVEAKSGDWGYADLFKVIGWMRYLDIGKGGFFVSKGSDDKRISNAPGKMGSLGLAVVDLHDFAQARTKFSEAGFGTPFDSTSVTVWRYAYAIERKLIARLRAHAKADVQFKGPAAALEHYRLINNELFFVKAARDRLFKLYGAYGSYPKLSLSIALEQAGRPFDSDPGWSPSDELKAALRYGKYDVLQTSLYLEHRARLSVLKAAIDYESESGESIRRRERTKPTLVFPELPDSFYKGMEQLQRQPSYRRYPLLWQIFLWGFGGFYLESRRDEEFAWLGEQSGIPASEVSAALETFDLLFPVQNGWFTRAGNSQCIILKMVPPAFRGIGANHRLWRYKHAKWEDFDSGDYTVMNLVEWNNIASRVLDR